VSAPDGPPRVFVTRRIPATGLDPVLAACEADVWAGDLPPSPDVLREKCAPCDGVLALLTDRFDAGLIAACPRLRVISNFAVGFDNIDVTAAAARGIAVGNTPGVLTEATADLAVALLLAAARRVVEADGFARAGRWRTWEPLGHIGQDLSGRTLGIVGMGRIGQAVARRLRGGWGMRVLYHDVVACPGVERDLGAVRVPFERLLGESDFVSVHAALDAATQGMFDAAAFERMKPTCVFVNTARGGLVVQSDLIDALRRGALFAAGLDVTDPEPPRDGDALLALPNLVLTPHVASATVETRDAMARIAAENLLAGLAGRPLPHAVA
jgi:glyoxylate reductase